MSTPITLAFNRLSGNFVSWFLGFVILSMTAYVNGPYGLTSDAPILVLVGFFVGSFWSIRLHAWYEARRIARKIVINHAMRLLVRSIIALAIGIGFHWYVESMNLHGRAFGWAGWTVIAQGIACALYLASIFWLLFDFILNKDRGKELFYVSRWYRSSKMDRVFSRFNSPFLWLLLKVAGFIAMSLFYLSSFAW